MPANRWLDRASERLDEPRTAVFATNDRRGMNLV